ncbi:MAG: hypothetical protein MJA32_00455 [Proteobacteria bacterium]|nr:hypothetical protein [Pseudomonadota bacterium]
MNFRSTRVRVRLPRTNVAGLSEGWLFKHAGDLQWQNICRTLGADGITSRNLLSEEGMTIYPAFLAVRAQYDRPIHALNLDDTLEVRTDLGRFGRGIFQGASRYTGPGNALRVSMLNTFVGMRDNELHPVLPRALRNSTSGDLAEIPDMLSASRAMRRRRRSGVSFGNRVLDLDTGNFGKRRGYVPSPYSDFNAAGLLYFAVFPVIADTVERLLVHEHAPGEVRDDWARDTSVLRRDVFYHQNIRLGDEVDVELRTLLIGETDVVTHNVLTRTSDKAALADVLTVKEFSWVRSVGAQRLQAGQPG